MPVSVKDRLMIMTSAAVLCATASVGARAQSLTQSQTLDLRGTEQPVLQSQAQNLTPSVESGTEPGVANADASTITSEDAINYGRPKPKKPVLYQLPVLSRPKQIGYPPLSPLTAYKTAPQTRSQQRPGNSGMLSAREPAEPPPPTVAVIPSLPHPPKPKREEKPYDPLGMDVGSLRLFPYAELDTGYDSNPNRQSQAVAGSTYLHGETGLKLQSQWSQHSLGADLRAGYYDYLRVPSASRPEINGTLTGRVDVTRTTRLNLESRFSLATQQPGSAQIAIPGSVFIANRPLVASLGQTVGVSQQINRLIFDVRGSLDRMTFGDALQSDGTELLLSRDNYDTYALTGRVSYELSPTFTPFVQVTGDQRRYDGYVDLDGIARNSSGMAVKAGTKFELTPLLTGEISAGYTDRAYVDPRLPRLTAPTIDASLVYSMTPLTTVKFTAATNISETTLINASGAVTHRLSTEISHALLRNLILKGTANFQVNQYQGAPLTEYLYSAGISAEYSLTRTMVIRGSFTHERLQSNVTGDDYTANVFLVGLKLQR